MKKHRIMVVGCGTISKPWLIGTVSRSDCEIVGLVDINENNANARKDQFQLQCPVYSDFDLALSETTPEIIYDLTFSTAHHDITVKSLRSGCHVFGEKPMCMSREEAKNMLLMAEITDKKYNVLQNRRYSKNIRALREAVKTGLLGNIWMTCCEVYVNADLSSIRNKLDYPLLQDQAIHSFDTSRFILNTNAKTVYCHSYNPPESSYVGDSSSACIFEMQNGSVFVFNAVMDTNYFKTSWHSQWRVIGSMGTAIWKGFDDNAIAEIRMKDGNIVKYELCEASDDWYGKNWHAQGIDEMIDDLDAGRVSSNDCHDNYNSMAMTFSAIDSSRKEKKLIVY